MANELTGLAKELSEAAEELRAISNLGLMYAESHFDTERYQKVLRIAARLHSLVDQRLPAEIERSFFADIDFKTPLAVVDVAVFDTAGQLLLIQRADDQLWAMPGGACDVGETAAGGAAREVAEETGLTVAITQLIGVFDSRYCGTRTSRHLYHFLFVAQPIAGSPHTTSEAINVRWFAPTEIPWESLSPGHSDRTRHALAWYATPALPPFFDERPVSQ